MRLELPSRSVDESEERSRAELTVGTAGVVPIGPAKAGHTVRSHGRRC